MHLFFFNHMYMYVQFKTECVDRIQIIRILVLVF